jgi:hypothetical protein
MGEQQDLPPGRRLVEYFIPFLLHLAESGLSKRTIKTMSTMCGCSAGRSSAT